MSTGTVALRVILSAAVGIAASAVLFDPVSLALFQRYKIHNDYWFSEPRFWEVLERAPGTAFLGIIVSSPLVAMAILAGILFRRSIGRHLGAWAVASPLAVWTFVCVLDAMLRDNIWFETHGIVDRLWETFTDFGNAVFLLGPAASGLTFYLLSVQSPYAWKRLERKAAVQRDARVR